MSALAQPPESGAVGRGVVAEIGRKQHGARKQILDRRACNPKRKAAAGGVTEQRQRFVGRRLADQRHQIRHVVFELADIGNVAAGAGAAMAADVRRIGFHAARGKRVRQRVDAEALDPDEPCTRMAILPLEGPRAG